MKKITFTIVMILILNHTKVQAQWALLGNLGTSAGTNFVGTTNGNDLSFRTNNSIKMRLKSTGELGIGTTAPTSWLKVNTPTTATNNSETFRTSTATGNDNYWRMYTGICVCVI